jgi:hypothetical protein
MGFGGSVPLLKSHEMALATTGKISDCAVMKAFVHESFSFGSQVVNLASSTAIFA